MDTPNIKAQRVKVSGLITQVDIDDRVQDWGEDTDQYIGSVLGQFSDSPDTAIVPLRAAREAAERKLAAEGDVIVACDVARFGRDSTVVALRQGAAARILRKMRGADTMQVAGYLKSCCAEREVAALVVDDTGVGGGVVDRLREEGIGRTRLVAFIANQRAEDYTRFNNRAAEVWWEMRKRYLSGEISTGSDEALIAQVSSREYSLDSKGRVRLEDKKSMGKSPDEADALAMTFAAERLMGRLRIWT